MADGEEDWPYDDTSDPDIGDGSDIITADEVSDNDTTLEEAAEGIEDE